MPGWLGLLGTIGLNYHRHRRGLPTICAVTRRTLPRPVVALALDAGYLWLRGHLLNGYPPKEN